MAEDIETTLQQQDVLVFNVNINFQTMYFRKELAVWKYCMHDNNLLVTGPGKVDHVNANYTELYFS